MLRKLFIFSIFLFCCGCYSSRKENIPYEWKYADLRTIDPVDNSPPITDIAAIYLKQIQKSPQYMTFLIKLDMLDVSYQPEIDLYLALDFMPGGMRWLPIDSFSSLDWDILVCISGNGEIISLNAYQTTDNNHSIEVIRDTFFDSITVAITHKESSKNVINLKVEAFTTLANDASVKDVSEIAQLAQPPPERLNLLFVFWDTFPAYTSAQALRRWDGAHTGPYGGHHGLVRLLNTANNHSIPIVLLDLANPISLSSLDYMNQTDLIIDQLNREFIAIPDTGSIYPQQKPYVLPDSLLAKRIQKIQNLRKNYRLPASSSIYTSINNEQLSSPIFSKYQLIYTPNDSEEEIVHPYRLAGNLIIPIPSKIPAIDVGNQIIPGSIPLEFKEKIVGHAFKAQKTTLESILLLGGSLPNAIWGDSQTSRAIFQYIKQRPWLNIISEDQLIQLFQHQSPNGNQLKNHLKLMDHPQEFSALSAYQMSLVNNLSSSDRTVIPEIAWDFIYSILTPTHPAFEQLPNLRNKYWQFIDYLISANEWSLNPENSQRCGEEFLGTPVCIFTSNSFFLLLNQQNGQIILAFTKVNGKTHQIIGPIFQLATGLNDPMLWDKNLNINIEPLPINLISDAGDYNFTSILGENSICFYDDAKNVKITYFLFPTNLNIEIYTQQNFTYTLPFVVDPWLRFTQNWIKYYPIIDQDGNIKLDEAYFLNLYTNSNFDYYIFSDSKNLLVQTEDPNTDKPPGHYLPIPMTIGIFNTDHNFNIELSLKKYK